MRSDDCREATAIAPPTHGKIGVRSLRPSSHTTMPGFMCSTTGAQALIRR
jgi:hypothetical protein